MRDIITFPLALALLLLGPAACGEMASLPEKAGTGPQPVLPAPNPTLLPTVNIALPCCVMPTATAWRRHAPFFCRG